MRRFCLLAALLMVGLVGCCHDTCDTCRTSHCPSCTLAQDGLHGGYGPGVAAPCCGSGVAQGTIQPAPVTVAK